MPVENMVFHAALPSVGKAVSLKGFSSDTTVLTLRVAPGQSQNDAVYAVFGRVVVRNKDEEPQNAIVRMTSANGQVELDRVDVRMAGTDDDGAIYLSVSLQGILVVPPLPPDEGPGGVGRPIAMNELVDIRCSTQLGDATQAKLYAILVDGEKDTKV